MRPGAQPAGVGVPSHMAFPLDMTWTGHRAIIYSEAGNRGLAWPVCPQGAPRAWPGDHLPSGERSLSY